MFIKLVLVFQTMFGVDTLSWFYILLLRDNGFSNLISRIMERKEFMITHDVHKELLHRFPDEEVFFRNVTILPRLNKHFNKFLKQCFDEADASLLEYGEFSGYPIITEDHPMLLENTMNGALKALHIADYFGFLLLEGEISPNELYQVVRLFREWKIIPKQKAKRILRLRSRII
ncbi:hypothetical protein CEE45_16130 [Candidatus Heimdallarchaeota archaeon B3_Heim]|nr:MAG: hypothetical protein CEE45_16130 [Candidatus Heimdallarchaeota archaeon B3_Heim]